MLRRPEGYRLQGRADAVAAHAYLARSYWSQGIPFATVERSLAKPERVLPVAYG